MSYLNQSKIASNGWMNTRVAQCVATENGDPDPNGWTSVNQRAWAAAPGWDAAWASAEASHPEPEYDPGADEAVITDAMILSQIQSMLAK